MSVKVSELKSKGIIEKSMKPKVGYLKGSTK